MFCFRNSLKVKIYKKGSVKETMENRKSSKNIYEKEMEGVFRERVRNIYEDW